MHHCGTSRNQKFKRTSNGLQFTVIASISWMMILVTLALGAFASAAPAGWPLFFQLLPGRSFIFWKYATGRQNAA